MAYNQTPIQFPDTHTQTLVRFSLSFPVCFWAHIHLCVRTFRSKSVSSQSTSTGEFERASRIVVIALQNDSFAWLRIEFQLVGNSQYIRAPNDSRFSFSLTLHRCPSCKFITVFRFRSLKFRNDLISSLNNEEVCTWQTASAMYVHNYAPGHNGMNANAVAGCRTVCHIHCAFYMNNNE